MEKDGASDSFEKRYTVVLERDHEAQDGYEFYAIDDDNLSVDTDKERCVVVYYFKKPKKKRNPIMIIESIDGDDFPERKKMISHFEMNHALRFSVMLDGFFSI
jgi:hypothetical protein